MAMNLSLSKLPWHSQVGAFVVLAAAAAGVFWNYYASPRQADIDQRLEQLAQMRRQIDDGRRNASRLPELQREVAAREGELDRLKERLPEEKDVANLLRRIQGLATQSSLTIRGFTPQAVAQRQLYAEWPIGLQLEGTYHNLGNFLERVSKFDRIINVTKISIRAKEAQTDSDTITAECTATTFVMADSTTGAPGARGAGAAPPRAE
ncbi:MAG: type 4a pilus biogenesis protein PilO [Vicinamibacterales bacterium]